jgi:hypothetical protein
MLDSHVMDRGAPARCSVLWPQRWSIPGQVRIHTILVLAMMLRPPSKPVVQLLEAWEKMEALNCAQILTTYRTLAKRGGRVRGRAPVLTYTTRNVSNHDNSGWKKSGYYLLANFEAFCSTKERDMKTLNLTITLAASEEIYQVQV